MTLSQPQSGNTLSSEAEQRAIPSLFSEFDFYLFGQGKHYHIYEKMGAHQRTVNGVSGINFAVWAPNARMVSVIGDFNHWDRSANPMILRHAELGIWECFVPNLKPGTLYKYAIYSRFNNYHADKIDPYGFAFELRPSTATIVADISQYQWHDEQWMRQRGLQQDFHAPISIYEVHLGSWRHVPERHQEGAVEEDRFMTYRELAHALAAYVKKMGFTHIELLPVTEYPYDGSWGYQTTGYYAPTSRFGSPADFQYFVDYMHQQGIGVILDWVPSHFPKDGHALSYYDGTHLYEYADPRKGEHKGWGTYVFDYGRSEVCNFLIGSALFWLREYHIDGLRVDAVASMLYLDYMRPAGEWVANQYGGREHLEAVNFLRQFNEAVYAEIPGAITIAEESTAWPLVTRPTYVGGLGFTYKWNMGWMHDMLEYMHLDPIHRRYHHNNITFSLMYAYSENFVLPFSHDEVVHLKGSLLTKMPGDLWQRFANLRALYGYMWGHPGKKLLFMGGEFGQWHEWNYKESLDWHLLEPPSDPHHAQLQTYVQELNRFYQTEPAFSELDTNPEGFSWIDCYDTENSVISFMRKGKHPEDTVVVICNFTPVPRSGYRVGVPYAGEYYEVLNSDDTRFGGSGIRNEQHMPSGPLYWQSCPHSILLTLPPLSTIFLKWHPPGKQEEDKAEA
ncbi:1,4-alpha-glucan branching enzyme [Thermosporothrix hazakensis]|jgi:1,4-alpha-glucan branching enzyme|uniref:1,4-alpha-glucan branching enzyme GlgB n=2 Tax=Thermosporothrix TaxID=768650 RepID=A0A326UA74_THEHA|nr:1,4-alpha-glucan branching protein GlgB [Thermosporothrix hazakensis]PZW32034.1 1,4-alpha-glucan branching enzyme [Thermosporothrix hazakensis]BBH91493.1 1,4-alpha-glucan branching enzyme GlgB [Thermosporothrix sp. COM3]GCE49638.1 1,4-alpha-glucan branching enzyme GlgB [Thermosporothrix hazakensis]